MDHATDYADFIARWGVSAAWISLFQKLGERDCFVRELGGGLPRPGSLLPFCVEIWRGGVCVGGVQRQRDARAILAKIA